MLPSIRQHSPQRCRILEEKQQGELKIQTPSPLRLWHDGGGRKSALTTLCCGIFTATASRVLIFFSSADLNRQSLFRQALPAILTFGLMALAVGVVWLAALYILHFMERGKLLTRYPAPLAAPHAPDLPPKGKKMGRVALQTAILPFSGALLFIGSCFGFVGNHDILSPNQPLDAAAHTFQYRMIPWAASRFLGCDKPCNRSLAVGIWRKTLASW
jgi:hypothetical protein